MDVGRFRGLNKLRDKSGDFHALHLPLPLRGDVRGHRARPPDDGGLPAGHQVQGGAGRVRLPGDHHLRAVHPVPQRPVRHLLGLPVLGVPGDPLQFSGRYLLQMALERRVREQPQDEALDDHRVRTHAHGARHQHRQPPDPEGLPDAVHGGRPQIRRLQLLPWVHGIPDILQVRGGLGVLHHIDHGQDVHEPLRCGRGVSRAEGRPALHPRALRSLPPVDVLLQVLRQEVHRLRHGGGGGRGAHRVPDRNCGVRGRAHLQFQLLSADLGRFSCTLPAHNYFDQPYY